MAGRYRGLGSAVVVGLIAMGEAATAQSVGQFYQGKTLRMIVGTSAGGEYDTWARLLAKHMPKHILGQPTFVTQNMPGAGGILAGNFIFNVAPRDGTLMGTFSRNTPYQYLMKEKGIQFEPAKFNWIGSSELTNRVCVVSHTSPVQRADELFEKEAIMGGSGAGTATTNIPPLLNALLGLKMRVIEGYPGANEVQLAMQRGEVHGICQSLSAFYRSHPEDLKSGKLKVLFNMEREPVAGINAPTVYEFAKTEEQRQVLTLLSSGVEFGRPFAAPPTVPSERVSALRHAFVSALKDPELRAEAAAQRLEVAVISGEKLQDMVESLMRTPPAVVERAKQFAK